MPSRTGARRGVEARVRGRRWRWRTCAARALDGCWSAIRPSRSRTSIRRRSRRCRCCRWWSIASRSAASRAPASPTRSKRRTPKAAARRGRCKLPEPHRRAGSGGAAPVLGALRVPHLRHPLRGSAAAAVLVQQPVRRVPDLPWLRQHHRARSRAGGARSAEVDQPGRDRAVDQAALPLAPGRAEARRQVRRRPARRAVARPDAGRGRVGDGRRRRATTTACAGSSGGSSARSTRSTSASS